MNDNQPKGPPADGQQGHAKHGYRSEVSWDDGKGCQPYANQGEVEQGPGTLQETEAGNRGEASGRNLEQLEALKRRPERSQSETPRQDVPGEGGVG